MNWNHIFAMAICSIATPASAQTSSRMRCPDFTDEAYYERLIAYPPVLTRDRLPKGYRIGRCLLEVDGNRLIDGKCAYIIRRGGDFHIDGPTMCVSPTLRA